MISTSSPDVFRTIKYSDIKMALHLWPTGPMTHAYCVKLLIIFVIGLCLGGVNSATTGRAMVSCGDCFMGIVGEGFLGPKTNKTTKSNLPSNLETETVRYEEVSALGKKTGRMIVHKSSACIAKSQELESKKNQRGSLFLPSNSENDEDAAGFAEDGDDDDDQPSIFG